MTIVLLIASIAIFFFFVGYTLVTLALLAGSLYDTVAWKAERGGRNFKPARRPLQPGISVIAAAFNEEQVIVTSVRSLLASDYDPLEVLIVDDGSTDGTAEAMIETFDLVELPVGDRFRLEALPVEKLYVSRTDPRLRLASKKNGGRSDALNAGINLARHGLVATVDADSLLDRDALARILDVFGADPDRVMAVGGTIRIANGTTIENGVVVDARVPVAGTEATQVGEYLRAFFGARPAWASANGLLIISGAFGVFKRDLLLAVGGFSKQTLGEDMDLTMRMHEQLRAQRPELRVEFCPDADSWTEAPAGLGPLKGQRIRWHTGLLDNLRLHKGMIGRRRFGAAGLLATPYVIAFEVVAPLLQVLSYLLIGLGLVFGWLAWQFAVALVVIMLLAGQLQTAGAILIEQVGYGRYRPRDLLLIGGWSFLEIFWYRPLMTVWRVWATLRWLLGSRPEWGAIPRGAALGADSEVEPAPLPR